MMVIMLMNDVYDGNSPIFVYRYVVILYSV